MQRDAQGKFALKNDEHRSVRSLRLTDTTWSVLGVKAESLSLTRADFLEQMVRSNVHPLPSNTRWEEEIERLLAEVAQLREENAKLVERLAVQPTEVSNLEVLRERVLYSLKLGKQAPGYKTAKSALNQFIGLLR